ncbi:MAG: hypothetical protein ABR508_04125 [Candidatus Baltobacteraceae bacterium]
MRGFLKESGLGWFASSVQEAKEALRAAFEAYGTGRFEMTGNAPVPTAHALAGQFAALLERCTQQSGIAWKQGA